MDSTSAVRTLALTERVTTAVRLPPAAVDFLLGGWRHAFALVPTARRHRYRLTPLGHVGVLPAPGIRIVVRPKIPLSNVFWMLDSAANVSEIDDASRPEPAGEVLDFLARRLAARMAKRVAAGLHRGYVEQVERGPYLRGRIDMPAQLRETSPGALNSLHDDWSVDVSCNQAVVATANSVLESPLLADATRASLRRALAGFAGVRTVPAVTGIEAPAEYRSLLDLCRLLDDSLRPGRESGATPGPAFLLDLARVFEGYVATGLTEAAPGVVRVQRTIPLGGADGLLLRPDLVLEENGRPGTVVDTKWKRIRGNVADLFQIIAYATAFQTTRSALVYPGRRNERRDVQIGPVTVEVRTLDVCGTADACRRSLRRLVDELLGRD
jgi:5-methylcytosine-specific restriction enzyme subunit McrC